MRTVYRNQLEKLKSKSVPGRGAEKSKLTPEKFTTVKDMFDIRINKLVKDKEMRIHSFVRVENLTTHQSFW